MRKSEPKNVKTAHYFGYITGAQGLIVERKISQTIRNCCKKRIHAILKPIEHVQFYWFYIPTNTIVINKSCQHPLEPQFSFTATLQS